MGQKREYNLKSLIQFIAVLTLALALIEVAIIYFVSAPAKTTKKHSQKAARNTVRKELRKSQELQTPVIVSQAIEKPLQKDIAPITVTSPIKENQNRAATKSPNSPEEAQKSKSSPDNSPVVRTALQHIDTTKKLLNISSKFTATKVAVKPLDTIKKPVAVELKRAQEKELSQESMEKILSDIKLQKSKISSFLNCVQVRKTVGSNVSNAFKVADFLKSKGYIISGRMTTSINQKGIGIKAEGSCLTVTIGSI